MRNTHGLSAFEIVVRIREHRPGYHGSYYGPVISAILDLYTMKALVSVGDYAPAKTYSWDVKRARFVEALELLAITPGDGSAEENIALQDAIEEELRRTIQRAQHAAQNKGRGSIKLARGITLLLGDKAERAAQWDGTLPALTQEKYGVARPTLSLVGDAAE